VPTSQPPPLSKKAKAKEEKQQRMPKMENTTTETVRLVMTDENGQHYTTGETQTIILGADGTIMNHNNEVKNDLHIFLVKNIDKKKSH
jgi:ketosteroid isomerase-like protein